jgi:hypothetical protein
MAYMYADLINVSWWGIGSDTLGEAAYSALSARLESTWCSGVEVRSIGFGGL